MYPFSKPQFFACLLLAFSCNVTHAAETITIIADEWCPYNCQPESGAPGLGIEIARAIFEPEGIQIEYKLYPWTEALERVRTGKDMAVIGAFRTDAPDFLFPSHPFAFSKQCFFTRPESSWSYISTSSLNKVRLGVIDGYSYGSQVDAYISNHRDSNRVYVAQSKNGLTELIKRIHDGDIDVLIEDQNVLYYDFLDPESGSKLRLAGCFPSSNVYIAFSPATSDQSRRYLRLFDEKMRHLLRNGTIQKISSRYTPLLTE